MYDDDELRSPYYGPAYWITLAILTWIIVLSLIFLGTQAHSECLHSAAAVHQAHGQHAYWSRLIEGHEGEKCYYAAGWRDREVRAEVPLPKSRPISETEQKSKTQLHNIREELQDMPIDRSQTVQEPRLEAIETYISPMTMLIDEHATPFSVDGLVAGRLEVAGWKLWLTQSVERADHARERLVRSLLRRAGATEPSF